VREFEIINSTIATSKKVLKISLLFPKLFIQRDIDCVMTLENNFISIKEEFGRFLGTTPFKFSNEHWVVGNFSVLFQTMEIFMEPNL